MVNVWPLLKGAKERGEEVTLPEEEGFDLGACSLDDFIVKEPIDLYFAWQYAFSLAREKPSQENLRKSFKAQANIARYAIELQRLLAKETPALLQLAIKEEVEAALEPMEFADAVKIAQEGEFKGVR